MRKLVVMLFLLVLYSVSFGIEIDYKPSDFFVYNDGHSITLEPTEEVSKNNVVIFKDKKYLLKIVYILSKGTKEPEIHFIHIAENPSPGRRDKADDILVLAVKTSPDGKVNETLDKILKNLHTEIGIKEKIKGLNVGNLLPADISKFVEEKKGIHIPIPYPEALWLILKTPLKISPVQYKTLKQIKLERFTNSPVGG